MALTGQFAPSVAFERTASAIASARRAALADRYAISSFAVEWRPLVELGAIETQWRELAARALEPNIFYEPEFALAAAPVFGRDAGAVLVWSGTTPRKLVGLFPARPTRRRYGVKLPLLVGWTHPYAPLGTPLVERDAAEPTIAAWLAHLGGEPSLPALVLLPLIAEDGAFATALAAIVQRAQMPCADFARHRRAVLAPRGDRWDYLEHVLSAHRYKELRRMGRRLADSGALLFTEATEPERVAAALADFFALEASGWKGKAGTAAAERDDVRRFVERAVGALAAAGKVAIHRMLLDGRPVAAAILLRSADTAWYWKTAYDESLAHYSPGMFLTAVLTEDLAEDEAIARTDSVAAPGNSTLDHIWRDRIALCDRLIAVRPQAPFARACRLEALREFVLAAAKTVRARLRSAR
ncbi:MAG TPA: GNAT family N-acetyltransferase [Xanthobacteraceae bacterium]|nr:GNAT family N-acetyltransferase [Xanthobacteraceae bacterium]